MRRARSLTPALLAAGAVALGACSSTPSSPTAARAPARTTAHTAPTCALAPAGEVGAAVDLDLAPPVGLSEGPVTLCYYAEGTSTRAVTVRFQTGVTPAAFAAAEAEFPRHGETVVPVQNVGSRAYSSSHGDERSLVTLSGSTELLVVAPAPLTEIETLADQLVARL